MNIESIVETYLNGNYNEAAEEFAKSPYDVGELFTEFCKWDELPNQEATARMLRIVSRDSRDK